MKLLIIMSALALAASGAANAQTPPAAAAAPAEPRPRPPPLPHYGAPMGLAMAKRVMAAAEAQAIKEDTHPTIIVVDSSGHTVLAEKFDDSDYGNFVIATDLARSSIEFRRPTREFADVLKRTMAEAFLPGIVSFEGGWPIVIDGSIVGAIGVTGVHGAAGAVEHIAMAGLAAAQ